jgi:hypothetical protein
MPFISNDLPVNPADGAIFTYPAGKVGGAGSAISLYHMTELIGTTPSVMPVAGRDDLMSLERVVTKVPVESKMVLKILAEQFIFGSLIFHSGFGWFGFDDGKVSKLPIYERFVRVTCVVPIGPTTEGLYLYEKIGVKLIGGLDEETSGT